MGQPLAHALGLPFYDLDTCVVASLGRSIPTIFAEEGESGFRAHESRALFELPCPAVVSLGGGAITSQEVREHLKMSGITAFLQWPLDVLVKRVSADPNRPLAKDCEALERLYAARLPLYLQADLVWTSQAPHHETVSDIVIWLLEQARCRCTFTS